jgi:hypothetical protein
MGEPRRASVPHCREHGRGSRMETLSVIGGHTGQCPPPGLTKAIKRIGQPSGFGRVALSPVLSPGFDSYLHCYHGRRRRKEMKFWKPLQSRLGMRENQCAAQAKRALEPCGRASSNTTEKVGLVSRRCQQLADFRSSITHKRLDSIG